LPRPGTSTTAGQRWVYRFDGQRKCWFQTAQGIATVKKQFRHGAAKPPAAVPEENEAAPRKQKAVADARAELLGSASAEASQPTRRAPEFKVVDAASALATGPAAFVPPGSVEKLATDQLTPDHATPRVVVVKTRVVAAPAPSEAVAAPVPLAPVTFPVAESADDGQGWMATLLGVLLMALGLVAVLGSSSTLREAVLLRD